MITIFLEVMATSEIFLKEYREKRDFSITPEPAGGEKDPQKQIFVIQKHAAKNLHYDLRLEVGGVLKSWAIPKGPSANPNDKRLAISTEDHPLDYAAFEGVIPEGQYGAGKVMVWDSGTYENLTKIGDKILDMDQALMSGHIKIWLNGKKLKGGYAMTKTPRGWLLVKMKDEMANTSQNILEKEPKSVLSGLRIDEI